MNLGGGVAGSALLKLCFSNDASLSAGDMLLDYRASIRLTRRRRFFDGNAAHSSSGSVLTAPTQPQVARR
ncbi:hypothetical protein [Hymenobacter sp. BRD67]|uniref:hypothetical protein n=1 Tax=Hymenobacter sp. BRD67 TaxID=2675877 RepID=UPI0015631499|nr:hypothetical protein [Hymenobacter sp. BRD67]QKG53594.1 hypothetical protein GKZ67_14545 [Hymenobacter sp. BRD67]